MPSEITQKTQRLRKHFAKGVERVMPEITRFYGIIIKIFLTREHNPPHFHAVYGEYNGTFEISTLNMIEGDLPAKAQELVREWAKQYVNDIMNMWNTKTLKKLPPLE